MSEPPRKTVGLSKARPWWPSERPTNDGGNTAPWQCPHSVFWSEEGSCSTCELMWKVFYTGTGACLKPDGERMR